MGDGRAEGWSAIGDGGQSQISCIWICQFNSGITLVKAQLTVFMQKERGRAGAKDIFVLQ